MRFFNIPSENAKEGEGLLKTFAFSFRNCKKKSLKLESAKSEVDNVLGIFYLIFHQIKSIIIPSTEFYSLNHKLAKIGSLSGPSDVTKSSNLKESLIPHS